MQTTNKHSAKVKSNEKLLRKKLSCAFCISVEYKIKRKFTFFGKYMYQIYFISCGENISIFTLATHSWNILIFFHRTRWNTCIFGIHLKKVNILHILYMKSFSYLKKSILILSYCLRRRDTQRIDEYAIAMPPMD